MTADYKSILSWIVRLSKRQKDNKGISLAYLAGQSSYSIQELENVIQLLEEEGYIVTRHPTKKVTLIQSTISGYEKAQEWDKQALAKTPKAKFLTLGKVIGGSLLAALIGIVWYWLGISNNTMEPLKSSIAPFKIYYQWSSARLWSTGGLDYETVNANIEKDEIRNPDGSIAATLNGEFSIWLDVESTAQNHQVNIQSIDVEITRKLLPDVTDIFQFFVGLGGGQVWEYNVPSSATESLPLGGTTIAHSQLLIDDQPVDYVYLRPGERETLHITVSLAEIGRYRITPIINYAFQDNNSNIRGGTSVIYYPENIRYWNTIYDDATQTSSFYPAGKMIVNTVDTNFTVLDPISYAPLSCFGIRNKWIAFVAKLSSDDHRLFAFQTSTGNMVMISPFGKSPHILGWDSSENLYFSEEWYDRPTEQTIIQYKKWNPNSGSLPIDQLEIPASLAGFSSFDNTCSQKGGFCVSTATQDTNNDGVVGTGDLHQVVLEDLSGNIIRRIGMSNEWQDNPILSPSGTNIIFREGSGCLKRPEKLLVIDVNGNNLTQITTFPSDNRTILWSPNGALIAYAANRSMDSLGNASCEINSYQVILYNLQTNVELNLTPGKRYDSVLGWSNDSQWVLIGGDNLSIVSKDGTCFQTLVPQFFEQIAYYSIDPSFSEASLQP